MNRYLKLVNFEFNRFVKIFLVLLGITLVSQIVGVIVISKGYLKEANEAIYVNLMSKADFISQNGTMDFLHVARSVWFLGPIAISAAALVFYIFLIWYRDWFGKNTFIYRLLMLPTSRLNVFFSKATAIFLMVLSLVAFQLIILPLENSILKWMVPEDFRTDIGVKDIVGNFDFLNILIPHSFTEFILYYLIGFMAVFILFTAILFERSYRIKGILLGIGYCAVAIVFFLSPLLIEGLLNIEYLYPIEMLGVEIILGLVVICGSIWMSHFLLKKKVTV